MYDGIVRTLEVWDVPEMKNLISLSLFDFQGYGYSTKGEVSKVCTDALVGVKEKLVNGQPSSRFNNYGFN
jgi:hypothetical protein